MNYIDHDCIIAKDNKKSRPYIKPGIILKICGEQYEITKIEKHDVFVKKVYQMKAPKCHNENMKAINSFFGRDATNMIEKIFVMFQCENCGNVIIVDYK